ncbi:MAG TPA: hypothetical protein VKE94_15570 [Gemmataceae bacterium]|nr:hypothetical protein [Gemmataceae bacterium]
MRSSSIGFTALNLGFICAACALGVHPPKEPAPDRIARLIKQLGDDAFAKRGAAGKELEAIGEPALEALRKAAATNEDLEIRRRAEGVIRALAARACKKELAKFAGSWKSTEGVWMKINGDRWSSGTPSFGPVSGVMWISELREHVVLADFVVEEGPTKGQICKAIFRLDGDALRYCGTYAGHYPTEFKTIGNYYSCVFKRVKE